MLTEEQIDELSIEELKESFFDIMNTIVETYGDDQEEDNG